MPANLDLDLKGKHVVGAAAVWRSPELLNVIFSNLWKFIVFFVLLNGCTSFLGEIQKNTKASQAKWEGYNRVLKECKLGQLEEYGTFNHRQCKDFANAHYRVYE